MKPDAEVRGNGGAVGSGGNDGGGDGGGGRIGPAALESIFAYSLDGIFFTVPDGQILAANPAACEILGLSEEEICARGRAGLADPADERWAAGVRQRRESGEFRGELRMLRGDGTSFPAEMSSSVFRDPSGEERACVIFRDASERVFLAEERERLAAEREVLAQLERVARDLHDTVIQRLFALGMSLQAVYHSDLPEPVGDRIASTVEGLDEVIRDIRATIFSLQSRGGATPSLRADIEALVDDAAERLGFRPSVGFEGAVDTLIDADAAHHVRAVLREALSNIVRHAHAQHVQLVVSANDEIVLTVADDGVGVGDGRPGGQGLRNMAERAQTVGGSFRVTPNQPHGTVLEWKMPRPH